MKASFESKDQADKLMEQVLEFLKVFKGQGEITIRITIEDGKNKCGTKDFDFPVTPAYPVMPIYPTSPFSPSSPPIVTCGTITEEEV